MDFLYQYILFFAKAVTIVVAFAVVLVLVVNANKMKKGRQSGSLKLIALNEQYKEIKEAMHQGCLTAIEQKIWHKEHRKTAKAKAKQQKRKLKSSAENKTDEQTSSPRLFVIDFKGSVDAGEVESLRAEITAILSTAKPGDEVLVRLESPGGVVHGYGLAASQLDRIKQHQIKLTVAVDKVAASGGYMMACVADRIVAAPFAILGSIGVIAQIPNVHRLLKKNDIDIELHTAGEYKRTLTLLGENTEKGREKFKEELNEVHQLFKNFVSEHRPALDINSVATGEHWFGTQALQKGLVDEIMTSDDLLIKAMEGSRVFKVTYSQPKSLLNRISGRFTEGVDNLLLRWFHRGQQRPFN